MQLGVFIPIGNNGWLISTTSPQYKPSFDLNNTVVQKAEAFGFDFALSMIKLHGFGGASGFWDYNLESFTLMAGLAAVTRRIQLFATCAVLTMPPPFTARMAATIDSISHGRFGVNIISGWQRREYAQMGIWPGAGHYNRRYDYCGEYVTIMKELWETGRSDFKGDFFQMDDCRCLPMPSAKIPIISAGQSDALARITAPARRVGCSFERSCVMRVASCLRRRARGAPCRAPSSGGTGAAHGRHRGAIGALLGMGEDHPPGHRLQDARHRDFERGVHVGAAILDDDHSAIIQVADTLAGFFALLHDLDLHIFARQQDRLDGVGKFVDV